MQNMHYRPRRHIAWACLAEMRMCGTQEAQNFGPICLPWSHLLAPPGALYETKRHSRSTSTAQSMQLRSPHKKLPTHATNKCTCSVQQLSYDGAYLLYVLVWPRMCDAKVTAVHATPLPTSCCGGEGTGWATCWWRHGSDDQEGGDWKCQLQIFYQSVFKVEEVVSKLNQIYVGSIFQEYGIQFRVVKVHVTMTTFGCKQTVFDRCSLQSWTARKENALRW